MKPAVVYIAASQCLSHACTGEVPSLFSWHCDHARAPSVGSYAAPSSIARRIPICCSAAHRCCLTWFEFRRPWVLAGRIQNSCPSSQEMADKFW